MSQTPLSQKGQSAGQFSPTVQHPSPQDSAQSAAQVHSVSPPRHWPSPQLSPHCPVVGLQLVPGMQGQSA